METLIRFQQFAQPATEESEEDITDQMPMNQAGKRYMHPGGPGQPPLIIENNEHMVIRIRKDGAYLLRITND